MLLTNSDIALLKRTMTQFGANDMFRTTPSGVQVFTDKRRVEAIVHRRRLRNILSKKMYGECFGRSSNQLGLCYNVADDQIEVGIYDTVTTTPLAWYFFISNDDSERRYFSDIVAAAAS